MWIQIFSSKKNLYQSVEVLVFKKRLLMKSFNLIWMKTEFRFTDNKIRFSSEASVNSLILLIKLFKNFDKKFEIISFLLNYHK